MKYTRIALEGFFPVTGLKAVNDIIGALISAADTHKGENVLTTIIGPYPGPAENSRNGGGSSTGLERPEGNGGNGNGGNGNGERAREAAAAFAEAERQISTGGERRDPAGGSEPAGGAEPAKRGRGRPKASGTASAGPERPAGGKQGGSTGQGAGGNVARGADEGGRGGDGEGAAGRGSSGAGRGAARGADEADRVADAASSWDEPEPEATETWDDPDGAELTEEQAAASDDEWPDYLTPEHVDETVISSLLAGHFAAHGGKDRTLTFGIIEKATGEKALKTVAPADYDKLAKALLKDTARYKFGLNKPKR